MLDPIVLIVLFCVVYFFVASYYRDKIAIMITPREFIETVDAVFRERNFSEAEINHAVNVFAEKYNEIKGR